MRGICRIFKIGFARLYNILNCLAAKMPVNFGVDASRLGDECQVDEIWTYCGSKDSKVWVWLGRDVKSGQIVAMHLGARDNGACRELFDSMPNEYVQTATFYTDDYPVYSSVIPSAQHVVGKENTWSIEGFNNRIRQLINRCTRKTSGFSRDFKYHYYLLYICICQFNLATRR